MRFLTITGHRPRWNLYSYGIGVGDPNDPDGLGPGAEPGSDPGSGSASDGSDNDTAEQEAASQRGDPSTTPGVGPETDAQENSAGPGEATGEGGKQQKDYLNEVYGVTPEEEKEIDTKMAGWFGKALGLVAQMLGVPLGALAGTAMGKAIEYGIRQQAKKDISREKMSKAGMSEDQIDAALNDMYGGPPGTGTDPGEGSSDSGSPGSQPSADQRLSTGIDGYTVNKDGELEYVGGGAGISDAIDAGFTQPAGVNPHTDRWNKVEGRIEGAGDTHAQAQAKIWQDLDEYQKYVKDTGGRIMGETQGERDKYNQRMDTNYAYRIKTPAGTIYTPSKSWGNYHTQQHGANMQNLGLQGDTYKTQAGAMLGGSAAQSGVADSYLQGQLQVGEDLLYPVKAAESLNQTRVAGEYGLKEAGIDAASRENVAAEQNRTSPWDYVVPIATSFLEGIF